MPSPRHGAFGIAGHAGSADLGPHRINPARGGNANLAVQRRAPFALAAHARQCVVDESFGNELERRVVLGSEPWPAARIRTACAASLARAGLSTKIVDCFHCAGLAR